MTVRTYTRPRVTYTPPGEILLRVEVGSRLYGVTTDDGVDDFDEMAIVVEHPEYVTGLSRWESHVYRTATEGHRSSAGDLDLTFYALRKYLGLACHGNPSILAALYARGPFVYERTPLGRDLQMLLASSIVSMKALPRYRGYMRSQALRLVGERGMGRGARTGARPELIEKYGFDTKFTYHMVRLGLQGIELAMTGTLQLPMVGDDQKLCVSIRKGLVPVDECLEIAFDLDAMLARFLDGKDESILRSAPDYKRVNEFCHDAYTASWKGLL